MTSDTVLTKRKLIESMRTIFAPYVEAQDKLTNRSPAVAIPSLQMTSRRLSCLQLVGGKM
jgi:hypothetical protein